MSDPVVTNEADEQPTYLYRHFNQEGALLYVGVSLSVVHRLAQHKDHSHWYRSITRIDIKEFSTRREALIAERDAIKQEKPLHNIYHLRQLKSEKKISHARMARQTQQALIDKLVNVELWYDARKLPLPLRRSQVWYYMDKGLLSYFELPNLTHTKIKRYVSGWQLIEFMEWLESNSAEVKHHAHVA